MKKFQPIIRIILLWILLFLSIFSFAQQNYFSIQTLAFPDTANLLSNDSGTVTVKYLGSAQFTGTVKVYLTTDTVNNVPFFIDSATGVTLNQNDSIHVISHITFDSTHFHQGDDIVVVWSSSVGYLPHDSARTHIFLKTQAAGIAEASENSSISIYPSIAKDFITLDFKDAILPKNIFISDIEGRRKEIAYRQINGTNKIQLNISEFSSGMYFLEIVLPNKYPLVSKFVKTE